MEDFNKVIIELSESINRKEQEILYANKELKELKHKHWNVLQERNKHYALKEIRDFININGNILDKKLHNTLRVKLVDILYKDLYEPQSYDLILHLMLDKLEVPHQYLSKKKERMQLQID